MQNFTQLKVFKKSFRLSKEIFLKTKVSNNYRLKNQLFGASTSIPANIAEMGGYKSKKQQAYKIQIAIGESNELTFWIMFCMEVQELNETDCKTYLLEVEEIRKMLFGLLNSIKIELNSLQEKHTED